MLRSGAETGGKPLKIPGSGALPGHSDLGTHQLGAPTASLCKARDPLPAGPHNGPSQVPGKDSLSPRLCVWSGQPRRARMAPEYSLQTEGKAAVPGRPRVARRGARCLPSGLEAPVPWCAARLTSRAQGVPWKAGRTPSCAAEMLWLAWRRSDQCQSLRVNANHAPSQSSSQRPRRRMLPCQPATGLPASACSGRGELCPLL